MAAPPSFRKSSFSSAKKITIEELYPELNPQQQAEAEFFLLRYLEIVRRIFERENNLTGKDDSARV
jgi:hypothetical protein